MSATETLSFTSETKTNHELPSLHEQEKYQGAGSLRQKLLTHLEGRGGNTYLHNYKGGNTVALEVNSDTLAREDFFDMSNKAKNLLSKPLHDQYDPEFTTPGETMLSRAEKVQQENETGASNANLTFLYHNQYGHGHGLKDNQPDVYVPSAVLVHTENLSEQEVADLRAKLPEGVPMLNAKTNELLDKVGAEERERGQQALRMRKRISGPALLNTIKLAGYDPYELFSMRSLFNDDPHNWREPRFYADNDTESTIFDTWDEGFSWSDIPKYQGSSRAYTGGYDGPGHTFTDYASTDFTPTPDASAPQQEQIAIPESEEVRAYREKQQVEAKRAAEIEAAHEEASRIETGRSIEKATGKILKNAKEMYDADNLSGLSDDELRRVQRRTQRDLHPDKGYTEGGDHGAFQQASSLLEEVKRERAISSAGSQKQA
jgi:hypothetical protein